MALGAFALGRIANAQCYVDPATGEPVCVKPHAPSAHCRITVGDGSAGSGTLVARNESAGLVLTCAHLFDRTTENVTVVFADGQRYAARVLERDRAHDLAALVIHRPNVEPVEVRRADGVVQGIVSACGFGSNGALRCLRGSIAGRATPAGATYPSLVIRGSVRPGDSGGAVLNARGQLIAVVWGERDGLTYATCGRPLAEILARVLGNESSVAKLPDTAPTEPPAISDFKSQISDVAARLRRLDERLGQHAVRLGEIDETVREYDSRIRVLGVAIQDKSVQSELKSVSSRVESMQQRIKTVREHVEKVAAHKAGLFQGLSLGKLVAGAFGLSGPVAAAVLIVGGLAGWRAKAANRKSQISNRRSGSSNSQSEIRNPKFPVAVDTPPPPQQTVTETHYVPYETDSFAKAHQWASEQVVRKYPGATEMLQALESLIKQQLTAQPHK